MNSLPRVPGFWRLSRGALLAAVVAAGAASAICFGSARPAHATEIAILVNDDPITEYDIAQRQKLIAATSRGGGNTKQQAIDELIDERLKMQAARRMGISAAPEEVDGAFDMIASRVKMPPSQFAQALQQIGVNPQTLKKRLEADITWRNVVRARFRSNVNIRDRDIEVALARKGEELPTTSMEIEFQQIILIIPKGSSDSFVRQRQADAQAFKAKFTGCDSARDLAKSFRDIVVKEKVRRNVADLPPDLVEKAKEVAIGGIIGPTSSPVVVELLGICDREEIQDSSSARKQVQSELMNEQGERLARRMLIDLKQAAVIEYR